MIVCAGREEMFDFAHPIGVGLVESTINLSRLALFDKPDFLLFIGSAGSYGEFKIFDILHSRGATQIELSFLDGRSYTPIDNAITSEGLSIPHDTMINSSNYITTDSSVWPKMKQFGIGAENMEFFSLLSVAKEFEIPAGGIFVVTNYCDEKAHKEYKKNIANAMALLENYVKKRVQ